MYMFSRALVLDHFCNLKFKTLKSNVWARWAPVLNNLEPTYVRAKMNTQLHYFAHNFRAPDVIPGDLC